MPLTPCILEIDPTFMNTVCRSPCSVKMVAIALRVEMKLRGRFTTYPKKRKPKELLLPGKSDLYKQEKKGN